MEGGDVRNRTDSAQTISNQIQVKSPGNLPHLSCDTRTFFSFESAPRQIRGMGLVVVRDSRVVGLHCSRPELHAGQAAIIQHGACLADCQLYFSRRPCATCLKMIVNAGVDLISFWPGDPEVSMLRTASTPDTTTNAEVELDNLATAMLKSNSRPHICVLLQPLALGLAQFADETSRKCEFMERKLKYIPYILENLFLCCRERLRHRKDFFIRFLVERPQQHKAILKGVGLENFCSEPFFSNLRSNMRELVELLATVAAGLPDHNYGFYRLEVLLGPSQEVARHCIIQARLLAYRTGLIAANDGAGILHLLGCGYNAYPAGSHYAEYPQFDKKQQARQRRKYRYIVHAELNNIIQAAMLFVTKCPCDECVPLIRGAGITHIYTTDLDRDKDKEEISYLMFSSLKNISKFIVSTRKNGGREK
uniref:Cytidine and dCMP deaminase domain-containing protein 1 n=1 Tax=Mola mola TaxID=94237 RepID=A0A3Q3W6G9_MOLML